MTYRGTVRSGVVVLPEDITLPEGAEVVVLADDEPAREGEPSIWAKLSDLGRWAEGLPADLAANHDHYLHGLSKRK